MAAENFVQTVIPCFDCHYNHCSMLIENFLRFKKYWAVVDYGVVEGVVLTYVQKTEYEALKLKDLKVKNYLFQAIDCSILESILSRNTSKQKIIFFKLLILQYKVVIE